MKTLFFKPFYVRTRLHCYGSPHTVYSIVAEVTRGAKRVMLVLREQISKPNLAQCVDAAQAACNDGVISRKTNAELFVAATAQGYRAPAAAKRSHTQHTPYDPVERINPRNFYKRDWVHFSIRAPGINFKENIEEALA